MAASFPTPQGQGHVLRHI